MLPFLQHITISIFLLLKQVSCEFFESFIRKIKTNIEPTQRAKFAKFGQLGGVHCPVL